MKDPKLKLKSNLKLQRNNGIDEDNEDNTEKEALTFL
jgi:hypothetical protein